MKTTHEFQYFIFISSDLPYNDYFEYFGPDFKLHISPTNMSNQNSPEYLEKIKIKLFENLRLIPSAPSVQMQRKLIKKLIANFISFTLRVGVGVGVVNIYAYNIIIIIISK